MEKHQCCERVTKNWHTYRCLKSASVERNGKWYCKVHDPVAVAEKQAARSAKWNKQWAYEAWQRAAEEACTDVADPQPGELKRLREKVAALEEEVENACIELLRAQRDLDRVCKE